MHHPLGSGRSRALLSPPPARLSCLSFPHRSLAMAEFNRTVEALHTLRSQMASREPDTTQLRKTASELRAASGKSGSILPSEVAVSMATGAGGSRCGQLFSTSPDATECSSTRFYVPHRAASAADERAVIQAVPKALQNQAQQSDHLREDLAVGTAAFGPALRAHSASSLSHPRWCERRVGPARRSVFARSSSPFAARSQCPKLTSSSGATSCRAMWRVIRRRR